MVFSELDDQNGQKLEPPYVGCYFSNGAKNGTVPNRTRDLCILELDALRSLRSAPPLKALLLQGKNKLHAFPTGRSRPNILGGSAHPSPRYLAKITISRATKLQPNSTIQTLRSTRAASVKSSWAHLHNARSWQPSQGSFGTSFGQMRSRSRPRKSPTQRRRMGCGLPASAG